MKKLFKLSLLGLIALLFFTGCTQLSGLLGRNRIPQALSSLLEPINNKNKAIEKPLINFQSYMNEDLPIIYYTEPDEITYSYYLDDTFTLDEATEDVNYLFEELKGKYGG